MPPVASPSPSPVAGSRRVRLLGGSLLVLAALAVYWNSLGAPLVFDDIPAVERNATIRRLWPLGAVLNPAADGSGASGRPLVNLSLALNYAVGGLEVRGFHWANLVLHALAALTLWGLLGRTWRNFDGHSPPDSGVYAWCAALLWTVHPLLTESVVCVVQRNEIMGSLFYLLTMYCFVRGLDAGSASAPTSHPGWSRAGPVWLAFSVFACLAGMASKEIVATAPLLVLLYDRTFAAGTFGAAWRLRQRYYLALAATWLLLAWLVWHNRQRGGTAGFGLSVTPWEYLLTQCRAIVLYLKLSFWPHPLVLDYGWPVTRTLGAVWWQALLVLTMLATTVVALVRRPAVGFLGASFFLILAPSSSFVPLISQTIAEHRMYLPLAVVLASVVAAGRAFLGRNSAWAVVAAALALGGVTVTRNGDYHTELAIWSDTVAKCPDNARAHGNLGRAYLELGRWEEAIAACREELRIAPAYRGDGRVNIARALTELGRPAEALPLFEAGLLQKPDAFDVHNNYGVALAALGRSSEAVAQYEEALRLQPDFADAHNNLANALVKLGRVEEALGQYETALRLQPQLVDAETNLGRTLAETGRAAEALPHFEKALRVHPDSAEAHEDLANALAASGRPAEALPHYGEALRLQPGRVDSHYGLGNVLASQGQFAAAAGHFESAVRQQPDFAAAQHNLAATLMRLGRPAEALPHFAATVRLLPDSAEAHHELSLVLGELRRWEEAMREDQEALRLDPGLAEVKRHLEWLRQHD